MGYRFRLHGKHLPGKPDLVFPKYRAVIQVQGCFWHGHDCHLFKWPYMRRDFWKTKITGNQDRDSRNLEALAKLDWRTLHIWECALKGQTRKLVNDVLKETSMWLESDIAFREITGGVNT